MRYPEFQYLGNKVRQLRLKEGLDEWKLGVLVFGYSPEQKQASQQFISAIETADRKTTAIEIYKLAKYFRVKLDIFFPK